MVKIGREKRPMQKGKIMVHPVLVRRFAENLRALRTEKEWTHEILASRAGITGAYVSLLESKQRAPSLEIVEQCARALGVDPAALLTEV